MSREQFLVAYKKLPEPGTKKFYTYMENFIPLLESKIPIKVYGFSHYQHLGYYWKNPDGYDEQNPNQISFRMAYFLIYGV
jgi:hypothetical protein